MLRENLIDIARMLTWESARMEYDAPMPCRVNEEQARAIAAEYDALPTWDATADISYGYFTQETERQFRLLQNMGIAFIPDSGAGYITSAAMMGDLFNNNRLYVYDGGEDHPILTRRQNWMFRAVHDCLGHAICGASFGPNGEERAWRSHRQMYGPTARRAMTTETRGQNSWVNYGPHSKLRVSDRPYAEQKGALLSEYAHTIIG